ncbi:MAG: TRAP transporter large permease [Sphaerochaeta sp.]|mgnify:CR=1 FL=1|jgi:tripartite ATP-independent transporter DctM subunit|uniref:TRAP transporter large permease n=2 Tax=Sphaerochaeta TaxID=399320 RepID=UPI0025EC273C|nr:MULTISPECIES: TRAP transporter large permease [unclassified Sphaerochaeta]MCK9599268.1 TRAP transporter large permease [Sphaerochaeta sp.]MDX9824296.1 TRAP transporter large permease [Sphaerochaeta sp.]HPE93827.1 TRAP transporter large permease [Sphaerochaeta sp.]
MLLVAILFIVFLVMGMPVAFAIGISGMAFFLQHPELPFTITVQLPISQTQNFAMLAVPLFIFAGNLMNSSGITKRLMKLSSVLTGHMHGGLAQVSVVLSTCMGGVSGSAIADASMEARVLGPDMIERGYSKGYTANVISWTALITATIPPGVGIILYGTVGEVSIGRLFASGMLVGLLMMIGLMITVWITSTRRGYGAEREKATTKEVFSAIGESIWALLFPILLLGGIRSGIFTPSEVGAFACIYAIIIGAFVYRELDFLKIAKTLGDTVIDVGAIMFIIALSGIFGYGIPLENIPKLLTDAILGISQNKYLVMLIILGILVILGMFMDGSVIILLFTPIFLPLAKAVNIDPVHFGILFCTIITMGNMTPPVGLAMYAVCQILDISVTDYIKDMWAFLFTVIVLVVILMFFPRLVLFLPNLLFG